MFNTIQLIKSCQTPLYLQLANGLSSLIENGKLPSGTKLPSIRSLAKQLKINRDTVVSAYKVLEQKGLAYGQTGRGTYVSSFSSLPILNELTLKPFSLADKDLINFSSTTLPSDYCSIQTLSEITSDLLLREEWNSFYDYNGTKYQLLLVEICNYFCSIAISCMPKQIRIVPTTSTLIQSLPSFPGGNGICIESPSKDISIFKKHGFELFEVPLNTDGMDMEILENYLKTGKIQYICVTPYLQNPTGICYSQQKKDQLLTLAKTYNVYIIEEDTFSELLPDNVSYLPIYNHSSNNRVIHIKHFSRLYLPNLHYSFVILPNVLTHINLSPYTYNFTDSLFYSFLHNNIWQASKKLLVDDYHEKYLRLCHLIDLYLLDWFSYDCSFGGIYIWLTLDTPHITISELCDKLVANHILISPGSLFLTDKSHPSCIRLSIARTSLVQIEIGIKTIAYLLNH